MEIKAIYINDLNYNEMVVFIYNKESNRFEHDSKDEEGVKFSYPVEVIYFDADWIVFTVENREVSEITKEELAELIEIDFNSVDRDDFI